MGFLDRYHRFFDHETTASREHAGDEQPAAQNQQKVASKVQRVLNENAILMDCLSCDVEIDGFTTIADAMDAADHHDVAAHPDRDINTAHVLARVDGPGWTAIHVDRPAAPSPLSRVLARMQTDLHTGMDYDPDWWRGADRDHHHTDHDQDPDDDSDGSQA